MKKLILAMPSLLLIISGCGKNVGVQDVQEGAQHISNIVSGKNASEVIANLAHATKDISAKMKESGTN